MVHSAASALVGALIEYEYTRFRTGDNIQYDLVALVRQSAFSLLAGYEDTNDADRLRVDPTMRVIARDGAGEGSGTPGER